MKAKRTFSKQTSSLLRFFCTPRNLLPTIAILSFLVLRLDRAAFEIDAIRPIEIQLKHAHEADYQNHGYGHEKLLSPPRPHIVSVNAHPVLEAHPPQPDAPALARPALVDDDPALVSAQDVAEELREIQNEMQSNQSVSVSVRKTDAFVVHPHSVRDDECLPYILFDKPVKTGSTAITIALKEYLQTQNADYVRCDMRTCEAMASDVCLGLSPKLHMINHLPSNSSLIDCLRDQGYYIVTSVREPYERWTSAYAFNKKKSRSHYGVHYTASYEQFMARVPDCSLLNYYDNLGAVCADDVEQRVANIVGRFDEIIDLYGDTGGDVYDRIQKWLGRKNVSPKVNVDGYVDMKRMDPERFLYEELKRRSKSLPLSRRKLCPQVRATLNAML